MTFIEWLVRQNERNDVTGIYCRAVFDDFENGNICRLADSACSGYEYKTGIENFEKYCRRTKLPMESVNVLMLGNAMSTLEYNIGLLSNTIEPEEKIDNEKSNELRLKITATCEFILAILQDMDSELKSRIN